MVGQAEQDQDGSDWDGAKMVSGSQATCSKLGPPKGDDIWANLLFRKSVPVAGYFFFYPGQVLGSRWTFRFVKDGSPSWPSVEITSRLIRTPRALRYRAKTILTQSVGQTFMDDTKEGAHLELLLLPLNCNLNQKLGLGFCVSVDGVGLSWSAGPLYGCQGYIIVSDNISSLG